VLSPFWDSGLCFAAARCKRGRNNAGASAHVEHALFCVESVVITSSSSLMVGNMLETCDRSGK
jgi:hypothetical protein